MTVNFFNTKITDYYFPVHRDDGDTVDDERIELNMERLIDEQNQNATASPPPPRQKPFTPHDKGRVLGKLFV